MSASFNQVGIEVAENKWLEYQKPKGYAQVPSTKLELAYDVLYVPEQGQPHSVVRHSSQEYILEVCF
jgi:hypothetical protein